jgi:threonine/homoserine/homoserine lactone efflux protein
MPHASSLLAFALVSFGIVLTPGPNMIYPISRSLTQGPAAGIVSLGGVALGFVFYMLCAAFGITALLFAVPYAYDALRLAGAAYLLWLAWQAVKPGGRSPFQVKKLAVDSPRKLFAMGFVTNLLNPKIAMLYLALLPQFIDPTQGGVLAQSLVLGTIQTTISVSVNAMIALGAGSIALFLSTRPWWRIGGFPQARPALAAVRSRPNWICRSACFVAGLADSWRIGTATLAKNLERLAASSAVSACGEARSGAVRKSRVKRASKKQEPNGGGQLCAA